MKTATDNRNGRAPSVDAPRSVWDTSQLLEAEQVAKLLQVPKSWVYEQSRAWEQSGGARGIPTVSLGRYRRYRAPAIREYLERLERGEVTT